MGSCYQSGIILFRRWGRLPGRYSFPSVILNYGLGVRWSFNELHFRGELPGFRGFSGCWGDYYFLQLLRGTGVCDCRRSFNG